MANVTNGPVTDPELLARLNSEDSGPITDPGLIAQLEADKPAYSPKQISDFVKTFETGPQKGSFGKQGGSTMGIASARQRTEAKGIREAIAGVNRPRRRGTGPTELKAAPPKDAFERSIEYVRQAFSPYDNSEAMDPGQIASAQIASEAGQQVVPPQTVNLEGGGTYTFPARSMSVPEYKQHVVPEGEGLRRIERFASGIPQGVKQIGTGLLGTAEWAGSDTARMAASALEGDELSNGQDLGFSGELGAGAGSMLAFLVPAMGTSKAISFVSRLSETAAKVGGAATMAALEGATEAGSVYRDMVKRGNSEADASAAATNTFLANLPLNFITDKLAFFPEHAADTAVKRGINSAITEGVQETGQEYISERSQPDIQVDPEAMLKSGFIGALTGGVTSAGGHTLQRFGRQAGPEDIPPADAAPPQGPGPQPGGPAPAGPIEPAPTPPGTGPQPVTDPETLAKLNAEPPPLEFTSNQVPVDENRLNFEIGLVKNKKTSKTAVLLPPQMTPQQAKQVAQNAGLRALKQGDELYLYDPAQIPESTLRGQIRSGRNGLALGYGTETVPTDGVPYAVDLDGHGTVDPQEILALRDNGRLGFSGMAPDMESAVAKIREMGRDDADVRGAVEPAQGMVPDVPVTPVDQGIPPLVQPEVSAPPVESTPHFRVVLKDTPLEDTPDHWTTNSLQDAQAIRNRMEESDGIPRKIIQVDADEVAARGGTPQGKSPYGTGADWIKTDTEVPPSAIVSVVPEEDQTIKGKVMARIEAILPETSPSGHPQTKQHLANVMAEDGFEITPQQVEALARSIREQGQPETDAERALVAILADDKRSNRHLAGKGAPQDDTQPGEAAPAETEVDKFDAGKFAEDMRKTQARWDAANDRATKLGTPAALAAQEKFENGDMEVEEFESILDGEDKTQPLAPRRAQVGYKFIEGEVVTTASGRITTPFPKIDTETNGKAKLTIKRVDAWLIKNAIEEARSRGDEFNQRQFEAVNIKKPTTADKDAAEMYLFGEEQPPVVPSILKPLKGAANVETAETEPQGAKPDRGAGQTGTGMEQAEAGPEEVPPVRNVDGQKGKRVRSVRGKDVKIKELQDLIGLETQAIESIKTKAKVAAGERKRAEGLREYKATKEMQARIDKILAEEMALRQPTIDKHEKKLAAHKASLERLQGAGGSLDRQNDDIIVAISKLGGLNLDQVKSEWGTTISDSRKALADHVLKQTRRFGAVFKKEGLPLDRMRETLIGHGYLPEGADINDLLAAIENATRGNIAGPSERSIEDDVDRLIQEEETRLQEAHDEIMDAVDEEFPEGPSDEAKAELFDFFDTISQEETDEQSIPAESQDRTEGAEEGRTEQSVEAGQADNGDIQAEQGAPERADDGIPSVDDFARMLDEAAAPAPVTRFEKTEAGDQGVLLTGTRKIGMTGKPKKPGKAVDTSALMDGFTSVDSVQGDMFRQPKNTGLNLIKSPTGTFVFAGNVPDVLLYEMDGGGIPSQETLEEIRQSSNPALSMKAKGVKRVRFDTADDALAAAASAGFTVDNAGNFKSPAAKPASMEQQIAKAIDSSADAINDILNGIGTVNETPQPYGEDPAYLQLEPHLQRMWDEIRAGGFSFGEAAQEFAKQLVGRFGAPIKPHAMKFYGKLAEAERNGKIEGKGEDNGKRGDMERDSQDAETADLLGQEDIQPRPAGDDRKSLQGMQDASGEAFEPDGDSLLPRSEATPPRKRGDKPVRRDEEQPGTEAGTPGSDDGERSGDTGDDGIPVESVSTEAVARAVVEPVPERPRDDIDRDLPQLHPGQKEDVRFAEARFAKDDGYGVLFTNGTGTGKTFTGLGIAKRFTLQGKDNILITAPNMDIISAWVLSGKLVGLDIKLLKDTKDNGGSGIVITTYANFGQNESLVKRKWDLVINDEADNLSSNKDGNPSLASNMLQALTLHPDGVYQRTQLLHPELYAERNAVHAEINLARKEKRDITDAMESKAAAIEKRWQTARDNVTAAVMGAQGPARPRVVFLSATPFAYEKSIDYANGYLFDYGPEPDSSAYNSGSARDRFFVQHFGYRMRYNKLTEPPSEVDRGIMQRQFNTWLKREGVLSGRMLDVDADYDRKFVLIASAVGNKIDEGLDFLRDNRRMSPLYSKIQDKFDHLSRRYLLEAIKAEAVIPLIKQHLELGRQVVVFHDFNKGGGFNPFDVSNLLHSGEMTSYTPEGSTKSVPVSYAQLASEFMAARPDLVNLDLARLQSPLIALKKAFPDILVINGTETKKNRKTAIEAFQNDEDPRKLIIVQSDAGKAGISLHDTIGNAQRVTFNLGLPTKPVTSIQQEGRTYRYGQASNAMFRYLNTGTNWERYAFATTIANRTSAAENLALGESARALRDAFIEGFQESDSYPPGHEGEGTGGKERDRAANQALTEWDRAMAFYFGQKKGRQNNLGADYFATPEPLGLKMVEWAGLRPGDSVLEPSVGHGAIARWFPEDTKRRGIEPSLELASRAALVFDGDIVQGRFEDHNIVNKYDAIVMNPPFGSGGSTAVEHLAKAAKHLKDNGRIVAIIPTGPAADKKFDKWLYEEETVEIEPAGEIYGTKVWPGDTVEFKPQARPGLMSGKSRVTRISGGIVWVKNSKGETGAISDATVHHIEPTGKREKKQVNEMSLVGEFRLPSVAFERAGTSVMTRVVILDKGAPDNHGQNYRDYAGAKTIKEFFDAIENASGPERTRPAPVETETPAARTEAPKVEAGGVVSAEFAHTKTGKQIYVATIQKKLNDADYKAANALAKQHGGHYSGFNGAGAIRGFHFDTAEKRDAFVAAVDPAAGTVEAPGVKYYHGTPHTVDKFSTEKIGTGEGAQSYGYGLYFAGKKEVAEYYREQMAEGPAEILLDGKPYSGKTQVENTALAEFSIYGDALQAMESLEGQKMFPDNDPEFLEEAVDWLRENQDRLRLKIPGNLYHVELAPEEDEYLDWDKPLSEQSEKVRSALANIESQKYESWVKSLDLFAPDELKKIADSIDRNNTIDDEWDDLTTDEDKISDLKSFFGYLHDNDPESFEEYVGGFGFMPDQTGMGIYRQLTTAKHGNKAASDYLHSLGIRGIRYLDGSSRTTGRNWQEGLPEGWQYFSNKDGIGIKNQKGLIETDGHATEAAAHKHLFGDKPDSNYVIFSDEDITITGVESRKVPYFATPTAEQQQEVVAERKRQDAAAGQLSFDFRPDTTPAEKSQAKQLAVATIQRNRKRPTYLGNAINAAMRTKGVFNFVGKKIRNGGDLAALAQVYRNPAFETLRFFFTKGTEIVGQTGVSSRLPSVSAAFVGEVTVENNESGYENIKKQMEALGADGYWILHNHPSGKVNESREDRALTNTFHARVPGFKGHVIINHNKYGLLSIKDGLLASKEVERKFSEAPDLLRTPTVPHPILGRTVNNADMLAAVGKELQIKDGHIVLVSQGGQGIQGIMEVPADTTAKRFAAIVRRFARQTGGGQVFAIMPKSHPRLEIMAAEGIREGYLLDVIDLAGNSMNGLPGIRPSGGLKFFGRPLVGRAVAEETTAYTPGRFTSADPEVQKRRDAAHGLDKGPGIIDRLKETARQAVKEMQHFPELDMKKDAQTADILRVYESSRQAATAKTVAYLQGLTGDMTAAEMNDFEWRVLLDDLMEEAGKGHDLPFGYTPETLQEDHENIVRITDASEKISTALEKRQQAQQEIVKELVDKGLLPESVLGSKAYFRHMVLEYANARRWAAIGTKELRNRKRGWQKSREGSELDINTNFLEAEFEVYSQQLKELYTKDALEKVERINSITPKLKQQAKNRNFEKLVGGPENVKRIRQLESEAAEIRDGEVDAEAREILARITQELDELDPTRPYKRSMAIGFGKLERMARNGSLPEGTGKLRGMASVLADGELSDKLMNYVSFLAGEESEAAIPARQILKAISDLDKLYRTSLGPDYLEYKTHVDRRLIPEGYVEWQPEKGTAFYRGTTLTETVIDKALAAEWDVEELLNSGLLKESFLVGRKKRAIIIPEGVAKTLDNLRFERDTAVLDSINKKMVGAWKIWTLLSPRRVIKYNLNNMSGDMDAAIAADPAILKYMKEAWQGALRRSKGTLTAMDQDMIDRGVLDSGISINEIPDINQLPVFRNLSAGQRQQRLWQALRSGDLSALAPTNVITKYFDKISALTSAREALLREAAYRRALELLRQGKPVLWASNPEELNAVPDIKDKAAKLSRELIGDYGNISAHGERIRARYIPFWSWMEINAPRYYRIFKNAARNGGKYSTGARIAGVAGKKFIGTSAGVVEKVFLTQLLFALVSAWNHLLFGDDEDKLDQRQLHIIAGKDSAGRILSVRFQGAFSDALSWFGLEDYPETIKKMNDGSMDAADLGRKIVMATPNKIINAALPFVKLAGELLAKKTLYPDITKPRQVRDRAEHAARFLSLDSEYRAAAGKPSRGYLESVKGIVLYTSDPKEQAYNDIRSQAYEWMEKHGKEMPGGEPTEKSNALYYYKQALRFGDTEAANKYYQKYLDLGGSARGLLTSIRNANPLQPTGKFSGQFIDSLSPADRRKLDMALDFYEDVYVTR